MYHIYSRPTDIKEWVVVKLSIRSDPTMHSYPGMLTWLSSRAVGGLIKQQLSIHEPYQGFSISCTGPSPGSGGWHQQGGVWVFGAHAQTK